MSVRDIVTFPQAVLRIKGKTVKNFDQDFQVLVDDMIETMRVAPGVGLAAPQVGVSTRLIVVEFGDLEDDSVPKKLYVVANPEILKTSEATIVDIEACLSVPGLAGEVERAESIVLKGQNRHGQAMKLNLKGWFARIFQHEIDHITGILYIDRATKLWQPSPEEFDHIRD